jgi:16S rRNA (cytidine1402-2'-O)-methyltransferase
MVATPIGNRADISIRALGVLGAAQVVYAEDTRVSGVLLRGYGITTPMQSYREAMPSTRREELDRQCVAAIAEGAVVAYVSDAGTPGIADPGGSLVAAVREAGQLVVPIPGASALGAMLSVAGVRMERVVFAGFLPKKKGHQTALKELGELLMSEVVDGVVFFESGERIARLYEDVKAWGEVRFLMGRELTKRFEEVRVVTELKGSVKGECSVLITR